MSSAISSADSSQDVTVGEERGEEFFEDKTSEISSLARKHIEESASPHVGSLKPVVILCKGQEKSDQKNDKKGEWGGDIGIHARKDREGNEALHFEAHQTYSDPKSGSKTDINASVNVDKNGKVYGEVGVDRHW